MNQLIFYVLHAGIKPQVIYFAWIIVKGKEFAGAIEGPGLRVVVNTEFVAFFSPHGDVELGIVAQS